MNEPRQRILALLGEAGCYLLCLVRITEELHSGRRIDAVEKFLDLQAMGIVRPDCYVVDPGAVMQALYGGRWTWRKEDPDYRPVDGEFEVLRYERPTPAKIYSHFVLGDGEGRVAYDPLGDSKTVEYGALQSKRILKLILGGAA